MIRLLYMASISIHIHPKPTSKSMRLTIYAWRPTVQGGRRCRVYYVSRLGWLSSFIVSRYLCGVLDRARIAGSCLARPDRGNLTSSNVECRGQLDTFSMNQFMFKEKKGRSRSTTRDDWRRSTITHIGKLWCKGGLACDWHHLVNCFARRCELRFSVHTARATSRTIYLPLGRAN